MNVPSATSPVLFFDGECGLCNRVVRRLLALDRRGTLRFAPLQGPTAQSYLEAHGLPLKDFSSLVFAPDWPGTAAKPLLRTDGVIAALRVTDHLGAAALLAAVPRAVTRCRLQGGGGAGALRDLWPLAARPLPRPEWAARFLDEE